MKSLFFITASFLAGQVSGEQPQLEVPQPQLPSLQVQLGPQLHAIWISAQQAAAVSATGDDGGRRVGVGARRGTCGHCQEMLAWNRPCAGGRLGQGAALPWPLKWMGR